MIFPTLPPFGLGLVFEEEEEAVCQDNDYLELFGDPFELSGVDVGCRKDEDVGLFSDAFDLEGVDCNDADFESQGTEGLDFNRNTDIDSKTQPSPINETPRPDSQDIQQQTTVKSESPRSPFDNSLDIQQQPASNSPNIQQKPITWTESPKFPFDDSWSILQQPLKGNEPTGPPINNSWGTQHQPIIIKESPEFPFNGTWDFQQQHFDATNGANGPQSLQSDIFPYQWDIPSPTNSFWSHFPPYPPQTEANNGNSNHGTNVGANNEYNPGFGGHIPIPQAQTSYASQYLMHAIRPLKVNQNPIQDISGGTHPIQQNLTGYSQKSHGSLKRVSDGEYGPGSNDALQWQNHLAKRLKTSNEIAAPRPRKIKIKDGKINPRTARRIELDPTQYYQPLGRIPQSWGPTNSDGRHIFQYNGFGELKPGTTFTGTEMMEYLYGTFPRATDLQPNNPSLFIQCVPSDSNSRYPTTLSNKCRFTDCPVKTRTIPSGHFRVAFDEQNDANLDPYHCAGYVHLYCLERFCSFSCLAKYCNLVPDTRVLREGRNRMSIARDHGSFPRVCMVYMEDARHRDPHENGWEYRNTLCSLLTEEYLRLEARVRRATRERQGGNNIGVHRNDMELYAWGEENKVMLRAVAAQNRPKKRKRSSDDEDGNTVSRRKVS
ncbi:hypothetical protein V495_04932 [Pseudogymnoascus sp. VKM F-4514 (FW-929)]|nr:hypothetical protein V495_04932 [Pseudogymnoascus sp. VKM F-4514 (FW-929)]KFY51463.1 hypothetical protein V497_09104 [Pseudogymnoascus sp. VKM F-4516 (FW-969)]